MPPVTITVEIQRNLSANQASQQPPNMDSVDKGNGRMYSISFHTVNLVSSMDLSGTNTICNIASLAGKAMTL